MPVKLSIVPYTLQFKQPAGTSRGTYTTRKVWYIIPHLPEAKGLNVSPFRKPGGVNVHPYPL